MLPPALLSASLTVIITSFVSIRCTTLPLLFYFMFPYFAFTVLLTTFWVIYDAVLITRDSEYVRGKLLSYDSSHLRRMSKHERTLVMKRAKALQVTEFPIGDFADISLTLAFVIWDEIVNQVLFLLSF